MTTITINSDSAITINSDSITIAQSKQQTVKNTRLIFVLDRSGSMMSMATEAIGGFNAFVEGQKKIPGEATLTLSIFDNVIEVIHDSIPLFTTPVLTDSVFIPRGATALYDAIGMSIAKALTDQSPDVKTIMAILTDGEENSSKEYSHSAVGDLIKQVEDKHGWDVLFLGAGLNVAKVAKLLNIQGGKFATFAATSKGMADTFEAVGNVTSLYRGVLAKDVGLSSADLSDAYASASAHSA